MKKSILIISLIAVSLITKAQGNLQFSQVITGSGAMSASNSPILTVPSNKVYKIEAVNLDGNIHAMVNGVGVSTSLHFPFWLKAGDTFYINAANAGTGTYNYQYSIIEFNIIN